MTRTAAPLILLAVVSLVPSIADAAEAWRCRIETERYNLPRGPRVRHSNSEYSIQFDGSNFYWVPVRGDIFETFHVTKNTSVELTGTQDLLRVGAGRHTFILDKRRHTVKITSRRQTGEIAYTKIGNCVGR